MSFHILTVSHPDTPPALTGRFGLATHEPGTDRFTLTLLATDTEPEHHLSHARCEFFAPVTSHDVRRFLSALPKQDHFTDEQQSFNSVCARCVHRFLETTSPECACLRCVHYVS